MIGAPQHAAGGRPVPMRDRTLLAAPAAVSETAGLTRDEWTVVLLSVGDGRRSLRAARARGHLGRFFLGNRRSSHLTSERLEALRRYAVLHRLQGSSLSREEDARLTGTGFTDRQAEAVRAIVDAFQDPSRPARAGGSARAATAALFAVSAVGAALVLLLDRWLTRAARRPARCLAGFDPHGHGLRLLPLRRRPSARRPSSAGLQAGANAGRAAMGSVGGGGPRRLGPVSDEGRGRGARRRGLAEPEWDARGPGCAMRPEILWHCRRRPWPGGRRRARGRHHAAGRHAW